MVELRRQGAFTIAQNERTSVVFGMPKAAIDMGGVDEVLSIDKIPSRLLEIVQTRVE